MAQTQSGRDEINNRRCHPLSASRESLHLTSRSSEAEVAPSLLIGSGDWDQRPTSSGRHSPPFYCRAPPPESPRHWIPPVGKDPYLSGGLPSPKDAAARKHMLRAQASKESSVAGSASTTQEFRTTAQRSDGITEGASSPKASSNPSCARSTVAASKTRDTPTEAAKDVNKPITPTRINTAKFREIFKDTTLAEAAAIAPLRGANGEIFADSANYKEPVWPGGIQGGGATCAPPMHGFSSRKQPKPSRGISGASSSRKTSLETCGVLMLGSKYVPVSEASSATPWATGQTFTQDKEAAPPTGDAAAPVHLEPVSVIASKIEALNAQIKSLEGEPNQPLSSESASEITAQMQAIKVQISALENERLSAAALAARGLAHSASAASNVGSVSEPGHREDGRESKENAEKNGELVEACKEIVETVAGPAQAAAAAAMSKNRPTDSEALLPQDAEPGFPEELRGAQSVSSFGHPEAYVEELPVALVAEGPVKAELGTQTDFPMSTTVAVFPLRGKLPEEDRFLLFQRCCPEQVDFKSWTPIPKPEAHRSAHERYLKHAEHRFPGTVQAGCQLDGFGGVRNSRARQLSRSLMNK